jgi:hypothetical protein
MSYQTTRYYFLYFGSVGLRYALQSKKSAKNKYRDFCGVGTTNMILMKRSKEN